MWLFYGIDNFDYLTRKIVFSGGYAIIYVSADEIPPVMNFICKSENKKQKSTNGCGCK